VPFARAAMDYVDFRRMSRSSLEACDITPGSRCVPGRSGDARGSVPAVAAKLTQATAAASLKHRRGDIAEGASASDESVSPGILFVDCRLENPRYGGIAPGSQVPGVLRASRGGPSALYDPRSVTMSKPPDVRQS
jgi:hypothetical protein